MTVSEPAASVRLRLPSAGESDLVMPVWNGNEFLRADGRRPRSGRLHRGVSMPRTSNWISRSWFTVLAWRRSGRGGGTRRRRAVGPGRGTRSIETRAFLLGGDETAIPGSVSCSSHCPPSIGARVIEWSSPTLGSRCRASARDRRVGATWRRAHFPVMRSLPRLQAADLDPTHGYGSRAKPPRAAHPALFSSKHSRWPRRPNVGTRLLKHGRAGDTDDA